MRSFDAHALCQKTRNLTATGDLIGAFAGGDIGKAEQYMPAFEKALREVEEECRKLNLEMSLLSIKRMHELIALRSRNNPAHLCERAANGIVTTIHDELSLRFFFEMEGSEYKRWVGKRVFSDTVSDRFPSTDFELEEESKCYALGRYTAAVFHLMRVLEIGLNALAVNVGADPANKSWERVLKAIQDKIEENSRLKPPDWKNTEQFYSEVSSHFRNLKNSWRNYVMHVHEKYDKERAEEVFVHVRGLMKVLATRISE
jgi:HEPN domain-containing protein